MGAFKGFSCDFASYEQLQGSSEHQLRSMRSELPEFVGPNLRALQVLTGEAPSRPWVEYMLLGD